jgi:hypothetical protein
MSTVGWYVPDWQWGSKLNQFGFFNRTSLPTTEDMGQGLANMTALLFWFGATTDTDGFSWPQSYQIVAQQAKSMPHVNVSLLDSLASLLN